jgi:predicted DNA-binding WGR domain protein
MAMYERVRPDGTDLWVAEIVGRQLCIRYGEAGGKGRIKSVVLGSEADATAAYEREIAARLAEGYELAD